MNFKTTSRKDDLIASCYLFFALLNDNTFPMMNCQNVIKQFNNPLRKGGKYKFFYDLKNKYNLEKMAEKIDINLKEKASGISVRSHEDLIYRRVPAVESPTDSLPFHCEE